MFLELDIFEFEALHMAHKKQRRQRLSAESEGTGERMIGDQMVYHYEIYPDKEPVDRNRGMCDRMVEGFDGKMVPDWDGSYITVDVVNDTIILRNGWVR